MINKLIKIGIICLCAWAVWWAIGLLIAKIGAPALVGTIWLVLVILCVVAYIAKEFGVGGGGSS